MKKKKKKETATREFPYKYSREKKAIALFRKAPAAVYYDLNYLSPALCLARALDSLYASSSSYHCN